MLITKNLQLTDSSAATPRSAEQISLWAFCLLITAPEEVVGSTRHGTCVCVCVCFHNVIMSWLF